jgi:PleD family two-component response regulator
VPTGCMSAEHVPPRSADRLGLPRQTRVPAGTLLVKGQRMAPQLPGTILVIDDEGSFVRALTLLLRRDGYHVDTAWNGWHALAQLQER